MTRILVVEDEQSFSDALSFMLRKEGFDVGVAADGQLAVDMFEQTGADLVLLDIMLPDEDGLEIVGKLRHNFRTARVPIMLVTAKTTELDKVKGLDIGADDYLTKPFGVMELISRVKALLRRSQSLMEESVLTYGEIRLDADKRTVYAGEELCELTYKEFELLRLLMANAGNVLSRSLIMEKIWGTDFEGESRTLDMHIKTLRQKLGEQGNHIRTVRNVGYQME